MEQIRAEETQAASAEIAAQPNQDISQAPVDQVLAVNPNRRTKRMNPLGDVLTDQVQPAPRLSAPHEMTKIRCVQTDAVGSADSEHEVLFTWRALVGTLTPSHMIVEVEVGGQPSLQLTHRRFILVEIDVLVFDAAP